MNPRQITGSAVAVLLALIGAWFLAGVLRADELIGVAILVAALFLFRRTSRRRPVDRILATGQSAALLIALRLLLPGGCLVLMGMGFRPSGIPDWGGVLIGSLVLVIAGLLLCVGLHRRRGTRPGESPPPAA